MNHLLNIALELMLMGMGTVFVFLVVLIFATRLMSRLVMKYQPVEPESRQQIVEANQQQVSSPGSENPAQNSLLIQIINEAVKEHRSS